MIYTIGFNREEFPECSVQFCLDYFKDKDCIQFDTETNGFDPYVNKLVCFQLGDYETQFVISPEYLQEVKELLLTKILVGQNIKFDLKFLYRHNIFPDRVWDTMLAEAVLYCGIKGHKKSLDVLASTYLGVTLNKSIRNGIGKHEMTKEEIQYSADDVKYLEQIKEKQTKRIISEDLGKTIDLENGFVLVLAYIEFCGMYLDQDKWKDKMEEDQALVAESKKKLNSFILDNNMFEYIKIQGDLFEGFRHVTLNWDSPAQVSKLFKKLGIPVELAEESKPKKKKEGETDEDVKNRPKEYKTSVGALQIAKYKDKFPIVDIYLTYKEQMKVVGSYGQNFLNQINPVTGRIHTNYYQIQDTGRISSGGKNKSTGEEYLNLQNIPSIENEVQAGKKQITRRCFTASPGTILVDADYSSQEKIILANKSMDENLLEFFDRDLGDLHAFTASNMYPHLKGMDLKELKKLFPKERYNAKSAGFAIDYGGNALTISVNEDIPIEDANNIFEGYFRAFPGLKGYFAKVSQEGINKGYILIDDVVKRKHYIQMYDKFLEEKASINRDFWERWKVVKPLGKGNVEYDTMKEAMSHYFKVKGSIERKGLNYPIQGTAASITKISGIWYFKWIKENNLLNIVKMINQVHDENVVECPPDVAEEARVQLEECMIRAGKPFCKRIPLKADAGLTPVWEH